MKNIIRILLFFIQITCIQAQNYLIDKNTVYYNDRIIDSVDINTFEILHKNKLFSKDKNHIYYKGIKTNFDAQTFEIHTHYDSEYYSDKNDVYKSNYFGFIGIGSISPKKFNYITADIAIDNEIIYWNFKPQVGSDASSIQLLTKYIYTDKNNVYCQDGLMPLNKNELKILYQRKGIYDYSFVGDKNRICSEFNNCYKMDISSFVYINSEYVKDKSNVLYDNSYLKVDIETFDVPLPNLEHYAKDKSHQFYLGKTFPIEVEEKYLNEDSLRVLIKKLEQQLKEAFTEDKVISIKYDLELKESLSVIYTFPNSNNTIIEKGKNIYMNGLRQPFIDANSFEIFTNDYAKDKNQVYLIYEYADKVIFKPTNIMDPNKFSIIKNPYDEDNYTRDLKNVYRSFSEIENADPNTFIVKESFYAEDKNSIYLIDRKLKFNTIKPTKGVDLKKINKNYFSFGSKIIYIDEEVEVLIENPNLLSFNACWLYANQGSIMYYKGEVIGVLDTEEEEEEEDDDDDVGGGCNEVFFKTGNRLFRYGQEINNRTKSKSYKLFNSYYHDYYLAHDHTLYYKGVLALKDVDLRKINHYDYTEAYLTFKNNKAAYKNIVFDIDLETFESLHPDTFARDKNFVFYKGEKTRFDPSTFYTYGHKYTSDKNGVYYNNKLIPDVDTKSFYTFEDYGFDNTYFFYRNKRILRSKVNLKL